MNELVTAHPGAAVRGEPQPTTPTVGDPSCELFGLGWSPQAASSEYVGRHRADS
jgi:hypothetical protein